MELVVVVGIEGEVAKDLSGVGIDDADVVFFSSAFACFDATVAHRK
ncbi:MAG: hypothetical protein WBV06_07860 [Acidimicrobiia bacterium]